VLQIVIIISSKAFYLIGQYIPLVTNSLIDNI